LINYFPALNLKLITGKIPRHPTISIVQTKRIHGTKITFPCFSKPYQPARGRSRREILQDVDPILIKDIRLFSRWSFPLIIGRLSLEEAWD
jgi:hypothetical protein